MPAELPCVQVSVREKSEAIMSLTLQHSPAGAACTLDFSFLKSVPPPGPV